MAYRGLFLIDKEGVVRNQVINDLPLGRNIDEMIRMVDALKFNQEHGEVCPAGWTGHAELLSFLQRLRGLPAGDPGESAAPGPEHR